jgi:hypothetical protein
MTTVQEAFERDWKAFEREHDERSNEFRSLLRDAERYRALRHVGKYFNDFVVVSIHDVQQGTRTYSGCTLDDAIDGMEVQE